MKYLCIHGHFYQPPRENAWTGTVEVQESAAPYHDWNARITAECYGPNASSRVLNGDKDLTALVDNYSLISFNFGPTLLSWLKENNADVYQAILDADKASQKNFSGHGSAIAQVYNHMIMPLTNEADKRTQIIWGMEDFKSRFNRMPEGMWLAETACDTPTLELLAEYGIKFTILAPGQCARVRKIGDKNWTDTSGAKVDPKRPYLFNLPSGKTITLFFYDGPISQGIAFGDTLKSGENFAARLLGAYTPASQTQTELVHIATDGETYGHHQKFADMALAYCLKHVQDNNLAQITIYGEFLEKNPPTYEAVIFEDTSWSCFHGVERWRSDCGCNSGMHQGWNQKWRGPLRDALDFIREHSIKTFDTLGKEYFNDPWIARNNYISVILADRNQEAINSFLQNNATDKGKQNIQNALKLMEMGLNAMFMYTSCGWFFDEISGIETVQIMQYAARVIELNKNLTGVDIEPDFITKLALAPSNVPGYSNGGIVYEKFIKHAAFTPEKAAAHYAISLIYDEHCDTIFSYKVSDERHEITEGENTKAIIGSAVFTSKFTLESYKLHFVLFYAQEYRLVCYSAKELPLSVEQIKEIIKNKPTEIAMEEMQALFNDAYTLSDLFKDTQRMVVKKIITNVRDKTTQMFDEVFDSQYPLLRELKFIGAPLPPAFLYAAQFVIKEDLKQELSSGHVDAARLEELMEDANSLNLKLNIDEVRAAAQERLQSLSGIFKEDPTRDNALTIIEFLASVSQQPFAPDVFYGQEDVFLGLKKLPIMVKEESSFKVLARKMKVVV
ncbi:alpha-amylase/alpha-mannosidase (GH57 family) [Elusimicrobium simillimum]|uniref:DUF3536 domain-containing protein n=1 Tax=Elusimicrobium simillimum TaxID=3143438 RepID=UPI003C6EE914